MAFNVLVIASVDENKDLNRLLSRVQDPTPSSRPIIYVSREHCIQHKLRNTVVALSFLGQGTPRKLCASVKIYSKESALFRKDTRFPEKLSVQGSDHGSARSCPVVVSNLLWWQIMQDQPQNSMVFNEDVTMPTDHAPIELKVEVVSCLACWLYLDATLVQVGS